MKNKHIFPITADFNYFDVDNFRTKKLEGAVELKRVGIPSVDANLISPRVHLLWKKYRRVTPEVIRELKPAAISLLRKYQKITIRTCFRFSGYENPRSMPAYRDLTSIKAVTSAIEQAYKFGENFAKDNEIDWFELGLIMMGRVEAEKSGIILCDASKSNLCVVEVCWDDIHLIASGESDFDSFWINKKGEILKKEIRAKKKSYNIVDGQPHAIKVPKDKVKAPCLSDKEAKELAKESFKASTYHKTTVEIEYMVRKDGLIDMYELQERKGFFLEIPKNVKSDSAIVSGITVNKGKVEGIVRIVKDIKEIKKVNNGEILILPSNMMGQDIPIIGKVAALITDTGGITAHISTIAKEFKIPCIVGTGDASKKLQDGQHVYVDADNGRVFLKEKTGANKAGEFDEIVWLEGLKAKLDKVGAKAFNLINLMQFGINVPEAFVVTTDVFEKFLSNNRIDKTVKKLLTKIDTEDLGKSEEILRKKIIHGKIQHDFEDQLLHFFKTLKGRFGSVSVRSSATCEDSLKASFAGQFQTFLFVNDQKTLIDSVKRCWASLYRAGAVLYAMNHSIDILNVKMGVIVQGMIDADLAGVMFTKNLTGSKNEILIEAAKGIGENVVSGQVKPDNYMVGRKDLRITKGLQESTSLLKDRDILAIARLGKKIERYFGKAQDIEWAMKDKKIYVLQSRPITT